MPGAGTKTAITTPDARLLDLSRLASRVGRGALTGVDRVEHAYLTRFLAETVPLFALVRTALGFVLLDRAGALALAARLAGATPWGAPDVLGRISHRGKPARAKAEADLRRLAIARCRRFGLGAMLKKHLPPGYTYFNTGHSNLTEHSLGAVTGRKIVLIHDTIPLDYPEFSGAGIPAAFAAKLRVVGAHADLVICNSHATRADLRRHLTGRVPEMVVAHLGVDLLTPDSGTNPPQTPYFVTVGTIEPRKNHALLLDVWEGMHGDMDEAEIPHLIIAGARGWRNEEVFHRLDTAPYINRTVVERPGLSDAALAALIQNARALLFPSLSEGYGLPPLEAAALGVPVIVTDLAVYREVLGDFGVYLSGTDPYSWRKNLLELTGDAGATGAQRQHHGKPPALPTWDEHFETVLSLT